MRTFLIKRANIFLTHYSHDGIERLFNYKFIKKGNTACKHNKNIRIYSPLKNLNNYFKYLILKILIKLMLNLFFMN